MPKHKQSTFSKTLKDIKRIQTQELPIPEGILKLGRPGPGEAPLSPPKVFPEAPITPTVVSGSKREATETEEEQAGASGE